MNKKNPTLNLSILHAHIKIISWNAPKSSKHIFFFLLDLHTFTLEAFHVILYYFPWSPCKTQCSNETKIHCARCETITCVHAWNHGSLMTWSVEWAWVIMFKEVLYVQRFRFIDSALQGAKENKHNKHTHSQSHNTTLSPNIAAKQMAQPDYSQPLQFASNILLIETSNLLTQHSPSPCSPSLSSHSLLLSWLSISSLTSATVRFCLLSWLPVLSIIQQQSLFISPPSVNGKYAGTFISVIF